VALARYSGADPRGARRRGLGPDSRSQSTIPPCSIAEAVPAFRGDGRDTHERRVHHTENDEAEVGAAERPITAAGHQRSTGPVHRKEVAGGNQAEGAREEVDE
jgi:hypothetical protein